MTHKKTYYFSVILVRMSMMGIYCYGQSSCLVNTTGFEISKNNLISTDYTGANANCIIDVNNGSLKSNHLYLAL